MHIVPAAVFVGPHPSPLAPRASTVPLRVTPCRWGPPPCRGGPWGCIRRKCWVHIRVARRQIQECAWMRRERGKRESAWVRERVGERGEWGREWARVCDGLYTYDWFSPSMFSVSPSDSRHKSPVKMMVLVEPVIKIMLVKMIYVVVIYKCKHL